MIANPNRKYNDGNRLQNGSEYDVSKPSAEAYRTMKLMILFQMTYLGAPMVYYGDEAGMWGAGDPDDRKPMVWPDLQYDNESTHPVPGKTRTNDIVKFDSSLFEYYEKVIGIRNQNDALRRGSFKTILTDNTEDVYAFQREVGGNSILVVLNNSDKPQIVKIPMESKATFLDVMNGSERIETRDGVVSLTLDRKSGRILVRGH